MTFCNHCLCQAFLQNQDMLFGGDFGQLPAFIMYATDSQSHDHISEADRKVYSQINKAFKLETI